jgi:hypothetical protein
LLFDRRQPNLSRFRRAIPFLENDRGIFAALRTAYLSAPEDPADVLYLRAAREMSRFSRFRWNPYELAMPSHLPDVSRESDSPPRIVYHSEEPTACLYHLKEIKNPALDVIGEKGPHARTSIPGVRFLTFSVLIESHLRCCMKTNALKFPQSAHLVDFCCMSA